MHREATIDREELARRDLQSTQITRGAAALLAGAFAALIAWPFVLLLARQTKLLSAGAGWPAAPPAMARSEERATPGRARQQGAPGAWRRPLEELEHALEKQSTMPALVNLARPWLARAGMASPGVAPGRDGWLYYIRDLRHAWGDPFLNQRQQRHRVLAQPGVEPDPLRAMAHFARQLNDRGVALVLLPVPSKAAIHPERFAGKAGDAEQPIENASMADFRKALDRLAVPTCHVAPLLRREARRGAAMFLKTDSHWTPAALELTAAELARMVRGAARFEEPELHFRQWHDRVVGAGDLARMAGIAGRDALWAPEAVMTTAAELRPSAGSVAAEPAEVLLLGDSFSNIYSLPELGFGTNAGLAERLSALLARRVDRICVNDGGATEVRQSFARALAGAPSRFARLKVVIWQFAERELSFADWKLVALPLADPSTPAPDQQGIVRAATIEARVVASGALPEPGSLPYREALVGVEVQLLRGPAGGGVPDRLLVYLWGMQENRKLPAARLRAGQHVWLKVIPWQVVEPRYGRFARVEPDESGRDLLELPAWWGELME